MSNTTARPSLPIRILLIIASLALIVWPWVLKVIEKNDFDRYLLTVSQKVHVENGCVAMDPDEAISLYQALQASTRKDLVNALDKGSGTLFQDPTVQIRLDTSIGKAQHYELNVQNGEIELSGHDLAAIHYGRITLIQLLNYAISESKPLPCLEIMDGPDFEQRAFMLDVSRDKVPRMNTLFMLIDHLSESKINEFQLYFEHVFAYSDHEKVWEHSSPFTAEEIRLLDSYCTERFIELVPNQNSLGHMENWLKHDEYLHLAECPSECDTYWGKSSRTCLDPTNPGSLELLSELYAELLPNFSSSRFNIGCDEALEICKGQSKSVCQEKGRGQLYLDFLKKINALANSHGKECQFWGDMIIQHKELIPEIPSDMTALVWGYDADQFFERDLYEITKHDVDVYVCPGTSTWRSEIGRNQNAFDNLERAATAGRFYHAKGFMITNWGDYGHFQPLSVVYPSLVLGAAYAWNQNEKSKDHLEFLLNEYVYEDPTENFARAILKLGDAYLQTDIPNGNANAFHLMLRRYAWTLDGHAQTKELNADGLVAAKKEIDAALEILDKADPQAPDSQILMEETKQAARLAKHGIDLGLARLEAPEKATGNIPEDIRTQLAKDLSELIKEHQRLWVIRNRPGGLQDSAGKLKDLLDYYKLPE